MGYFRENIEQAKGYTPGFQPSFAKAAESGPKEGDVVKLNTNENPYPPSPAVLDALARIEPEQLRRYPDPLGNSFRQTAAELNGLSVENIMCCNGGDDLLSIAFRAFCDKKHPVAYPVPTYSLYPVLARLQNCRAIEIPFDDRNSLPEALAAAGAALTIVCNPNAPTGTFVEVDDIAELAGKLQSVLLVDEAYVDFAEDSCAGLVRNFDNVIILRSMSKGYSLAGLRFGYAIGQADLIAGLIKVKDSYNVDTLAIKAATAAIKDQQYFRQNIKKVKEARRELTESLRKMGFEVPDSFANFLLARSKNYKAAEIYGKLAQRNIYVRYFDLPGLEDKLRITVGTDKQNDKLLAALRQILS